MNWLKFAQKIHKIVSHEGCFACQTMAIITISASSSCFPGTCAVRLNSIMSYTPALQLLQTPLDFAIQVSAEHECVSDIICLTSGKYESCMDVYICLEKPVITLYRGNITFARQSLNYAPDKFTLPSFSDIFGGFFSFSWLKVGIAIGSIMLVIFFLSCFLIIMRKPKL